MIQYIVCSIGIIYFMNGCKSVTPVRNETIIDAEIIEQTDIIKEILKKDKKNYNMSEMQRIYELYRELAILKQPTKISIDAEKNDYMYKEVESMTCHIFSFHGGVYDLTPWFDIHETLIPIGGIGALKGELTEANCKFFYMHTVKYDNIFTTHKSLDILICCRIGSISRNDTNYSFTYLYPQVINSNGPGMYEKSDIQL